MGRMHEPHFGPAVRFDTSARLWYTHWMMHAILRPWVLAGVGILGGVVAARDARADGMRCGERLVASGDSSHLVRSKCGAPQATERRKETETVRRRVVVPCRTAVGGGVCVEEQEHTVIHDIETWTYDFGPARLVHYATFVDGTLRDVRTGGYGTRTDVD
jgi:hypothetical protein